MPTIKEQSPPSHCNTSSKPNNKQSHLTVMRHRMASNIMSVSTHILQRNHYIQQRRLPIQQRGALDTQKGSAIYSKRRRLYTTKESFGTFSKGLLFSKKRRLPTLPRVCSTIGADGLNFSVRNGKRWNPDTITT